MPRMMSKNVFQNRLIENGKDGLVTDGEEFECSDDLAKDYERLGYAERIDGSTSDQVEATGEQRPIPDALLGVAVSDAATPGIATAGIATTGIANVPEQQPDLPAVPEPTPVAEPAPEVIPPADEQIPPAHVDVAPVSPSADQPVAENEDGTDVTAPIDPASLQDAAKAEKASKVPANKKAAEPANKAAPDASIKAAE